MKPDDHIADAISAGSLVLAVLAALYTLWLGDVNAAIALTPKPDKQDREPQKRLVLSAIVTKSLPLSGATLVAFFVLLPRTLAILAEVAYHPSNWSYDDVKTLFVLTTALILLLAIVAIVQLVQLVNKQLKL